MSETILFSRPCYWARDTDGKLTLRPAPKLAGRKPDEPFTWDLARAALRRRTRR